MIDCRVIVDGRSRYLAAKQLGIKRVPVIRASLNPDDPVLYMLHEATKRRLLTDDQRACLAREGMEILSQIATRTPRGRCSCSPPEAQLLQHFQRVSINLSSVR